ncbi:MAG TPA: ABC transporter permease, partial [Calditrichae bacterium]|nr:ABC transporter permease [Calditrichia bacterium]
MGLLMKIGWRNLWRNKRRTVVTIAAITFATAVFMFTRGMQYGTYDVNIREITRLFSGPLQIQHRDYQDTPNLFHSFLLSDSLVQQVTTVPGVRAVTPRVYTEGLIAFNHNSMGVTLIAVDPRTEPQVTTIHQKIKEGTFLQPGHRWEIVAGEKLLKNLNAAVGDTVVLLTQGFDGSMGNMK